MPLSKIREATGEALTALIRLRNLDEGTSAPPEELNRELVEILGRVQQRARRVGYSDEEIEDVLYALVAALDEVALQRAGPIADHWISNLLQMHFFDENVAGDVFFVRLERLLETPGSARGPGWRDVLQIYFFCLSFGFQGRYKIRGGEGELLEIVERARAASVPPDEGLPLSPRGARPDERRVELRRSLPLIGLAIVILVAAALVYLALRLSLNRSLARAQQCIAAVGSRGGDALKTSASLCTREGASGSSEEEPP